MNLSADCLCYRVEIASASAHLFRVSLRFLPQDTQTRLSLPAWIPGSYMIREFAKNIVELDVSQNGKALAWRKTAKADWLIEKAKLGVPVCVTYTVYAWDLSVRCAHLDQTHAFFNGTQVYLSVAGFEAGRHFVELCAPAETALADWRVATTLPVQRGTKRGSFGHYVASDYDALVDHPVEMGTFQTVKFKAGGVAHEMAVTGRVSFDDKRLAADLQKICDWQINFFGGDAPFSRYLFQTYALGDGYGGLEHRDSTALICSRNDLPAHSMSTMGEAYRGFLGLCSHEYFHSWNVKRIKPAAFLPYRLDQENYTSLLWVFEGFTSYYDDVVLLRAGVIGVNDYLALFAKNISNIERGQGRFKQSAAASSFDAWTKFYRQDENAPNAIVSYYTKGALIAAGLDLTIRLRSGGKRSLDDVMRYLWQHYGAQGIGVGEDEMPAIIVAATGVDVAAEIAAWAYGTEDVPMDALLAEFGVAASRKVGALSSGMGIKAGRGEGGGLRLLQVLDDGAAQAAGLSAGDELIALDGLRLTDRNVDALLSRYRVGDQISVTAFRRDEMMQFTLNYAAPRFEVCELKLANKPGAAIMKRRKALLGG